MKMLPGTVYHRELELSTESSKKLVVWALWNSLGARRLSLSLTWGIEEGQMLRSMIVVRLEKMSNKVWM